MTARDFFYRPDGLLHAPWRLLAFALITAASVVVVGWVVFAIVPGSMPNGAATSLDIQQFTLSAVVLVAALLIAHAVMLRWIDKLPWSYVGLGAGQASPRRLGLGLALGALAIGVPSLLLVGVDWLAPHNATAGSWLLFALRVALLLLPAALYEELMMRGYLFAVLRDAWGWKSALVATSVAFGLLHLTNPGADAQSIIAVMVAGVFLGGILVATGSVYATWMAHFAWNWVMAALLHTAVSGLPLAGPDYRIVDAGPDWATGGPWGPEGGAGAVAGMLAGLLYLYTRWQRRVARSRDVTVSDTHSNHTMDHQHG